MQGIIKNLWRSLFAGKNAMYHIAAIVITYVFVVTKIDWNFLVLARGLSPHIFLYSADVLGYILPVVITGGFLFVGYANKSKRSAVARITGHALAQTILLSVFIAGVYKSIAGRVYPPHHGVLVDISNQFNFGFMQESILGGWPSSHAAVAFAIAFCLITLYPKRKMMHVIALLTAAGIGLGVALGFHWLSELVAGTLIGITIGTTVGLSYLPKLKSSV